MNVTIIPNDPGCKPVKPGCPVPPANGIAGYDDTVTDFITASPDMGVVLRTDTKVAKLHKGDLVQNLVYVDKSMQLQTITGVLTKVLCKVVAPQKPSIPDGACPPPPHCHPCAPEMIQPAVLVLDVSTEYDASVFKIPISSIRDFESDEIDPKDVRIWDIDFITDTQVIFYSKFEPQIVRWNGEDVEFTETRGNVENATRYLITVNSMMAENVLTVIGTGGAIVTRSVKGIAPEIHDTFSIDVVLNKVNELIKNYYNVTANDSGVTIPQKELYVNILTHCHGVKSIDLVDSDGNIVYDYTVDEIMPLSLGMNSFSYQEIAKVSGDLLMIQAPVLLYLMREIAANGYQFRVNGFDIDLSVPVDSVWMNQLVASNVLVYDGSDPRNHAKVCNNEIILTRYDGTCGVSFILSDQGGERLPDTATFITAVRNVDEEGSVTKPTSMCIDAATDDDMLTTAVYVGYTTDEITEDSTKKIIYDIIAPSYGSVSMKITVNTKVE